MNKMGLVPRGFRLEFVSILRRLGRALPDCTRLVHIHPGDSCHFYLG